MEKSNLLTLKKALEEARLDDFIKQQWALRGNKAKLKEMLNRAVTAVKQSQKGDQK
jgi:hypothetical protein